MRRHQITGALFGAKGIKNSVRITKTVNDWQNYSNQDLDSKGLKSFSEYLIEKEKMRYHIHYEQILLKDKLQTKDILSNLDGALLDMEAKRLVEVTIKSLKLSPELEKEKIAQDIQHDLEQLHQGIPKAIIEGVTKIAVEHIDTVITEDNKLQKTYNLNNQDNHNQSIKPLNLTRADLPILALSCAADILNYNQSLEHASTNHILEQNSHRANQAHQISLVHSSNIIKNSFKTRIELESTQFQQHQITQKQMSQQRDMES